MLENIKVGDLVVFKDGNEAIVKKVVDDGLGNFSLMFNNKVSSGLHEGASLNGWIYDASGKWKRGDEDSEDYNDIVKVVSC